MISQLSRMNQQLPNIPGAQHNEQTGYSSQSSIVVHDHSKYYLHSTTYAGHQLPDGRVAAPPNPVRRGQPSYSMLRLPESWLAMTEVQIAADAPDPGLPQKERPKREGRKPQDLPEHDSYAGNQQLLDRPGLAEDGAARHLTAEGEGTNFTKWRSPRTGGCELLGFGRDTQTPSQSGPRSWKLIFLSPPPFLESCVLKSQSVSS